MTNFTALLVVLFKYSLHSSWWMECKQRSFTGVKLLVYWFYCSHHVVYWSLYNTEHRDRRYGTIQLCCNYRNKRRPSNKRRVFWSCTPVSHKRRRPMEDGSLVDKISCRKLTYNDEVLRPQNLGAVAIAN